MKIKELYNTLNNISPITNEAWDDMQQLLEPLEVKKNDYLIKEGSKAKYCYLLTEGVIRVYFNKEGNEYNKTFFIPGMFPTAITALISNSPSAISFQALLPSQLIQFSFNEFRNLFSKHRCLETLLLRILEQQWIKKERHDIRMVTNDATTNYLIFREEFPSLENIIPQYHIASDLGITPVQLSRIRAQLAKKY